jgi:adenine-specific DNA-methyltransferase
MSDEPSKVELASPDLAAEKREAFEDLFPGVLADGVLDATRLGELLDTPISHAADARERFGLMWAGKQEAVRSLLKPSRGALAPDLENSIDFDTAQNVFIEGDNLEVLKLLQKAYNDKVKLIYIDPPYNTGNDFVYNDDFSDGLRGYLEYTGQLDDEGRLTSTNADTAGRKHSRWLSMMYPRLVLARNLLTQDGVIFISIDDHEVAQLRLILDEIFGPENFVENYIWESSFRPDNSSSIERENSQHVLCYARNKSGVQRLVGSQQGSEGLPSLTKNSMAASTLRFEPEWVDLLIPDGTYGPGDMGAGYTLEDEVVVSAGRATKAFRVSGRVIWGQSYLEKQAESGTRIVIKSKTFVPYSKKAQTARLPPTSLLPRSDVGDVLAGNAELKALFGAIPFNHPKPTSLVGYLARAVTNEDKTATILDFFAGSGSTAHAIALLNASDGGQRRVISVNLPEPTPECGTARDLGFEVVSEVTRARIEKVVHGVAGARDMGLRVYRLSESAFLDPTTEDGALNLNPSTRREEVDNVYAVAAEVLLQEGVPLDAKWIEHECDGVAIHVSDEVAVAVGSELDEPAIDEILALGVRVVVFLEDAGITMKTV